MVITIPEKDNLGKVPLIYRKAVSHPAAANSSNCEKEFLLEPVCHFLTRHEVTLTLDCVKSRHNWSATSSVHNNHCLCSDNTAQLHTKL